MKKQNALLALTTAATALPGVQANAQQIAENFEFGYRHHSYEEDPIAQENTLGDQLDRYDIDVNQFKLIAPLSDNMQLDIDYQTEKMSGASPWYTFQLPGQAPVQIMSGASIEDERTDIAAKLRYAWDRKSVDFSVATSDEDDYESLSFGFAYTFETNNRLSTHTLATDVSNDDIFPVDADIFLTRPATEQSKHSRSFLYSYSRIINKNTLTKFSIGLSRKSGYLSDPYKAVFVNFQLLGDTRPDTRTAKTATAQVRYFVDELDAAFHADYRLYDDNWDIRSHTFDFAWHQNLGMGFQIIPSLRLYSQTDAYFYEVFHEEVREDGLYTTDYRLSEYGAITLGLKLTKSFEDWSLTASFERYRSGANTGLASSDTENPALIDFDLVSVGANFRF